MLIIVELNILSLSGCFVKYSTKLSIKLSGFQFSHDCFGNSLYGLSSFPRKRFQVGIFGRNIDNYTSPPGYFDPHFAEPGLDFPDLPSEHLTPGLIESEAYRSSFVKNYRSKTLPFVLIGNYGQVYRRPPLFHDNILQKHIEGAGFKELIDNVLVEMRVHINYISLDNYYLCIGRFSIICSGGFSDKYPECIGNML